MLSLSLLCSSISGTRNKEHEAGVNTLALSETSDTKLFVVLVIIREQQQDSSRHVWDTYACSCQTSLGQLQWERLH